MNGEFEPIRYGLLYLFITLNTVSCGEHILEAEQDVITVKDRVRSFLTTISFRKVPDCMIIEIILGQVFWLNLFPNKYLVSKTMIPRHIMSGLKVYYRCHCRLPVGHNAIAPTVCSIILLPLCSCV